MADSEFISKSGYIAKLQINEKLLGGWISRNWVNSYHYVVIGHTTLIHVKRADDWIAAHGRLKSAQEFARRIYVIEQSYRTSTPTQGYEPPDGI